VFSPKTLRVLAGTDFGIQLFPRGKTASPLTYEGSNESSSAFYYWASRQIPKYVTKHWNVEDIDSWVHTASNYLIQRNSEADLCPQTKDKYAVLLLTKDKKIPLLWSVLANKYAGRLEMAYNRDRRGKSSVKMGMEAGGKNEPKILVYSAGSTTPFRYEGMSSHDLTQMQPEQAPKGINKLDSLSRFFDSLIEGGVDVKTANKEAMTEEFVPDKRELDIERKQEAQRLALAHGGFSSLIDFEKAIKEGHGADYHDVHGYPGMMGEPPARNTKDRSEGDDTEEKDGASSSSRISDEL
jgi:protein disulfide-isomerase A6